MLCGGWLGRRETVASVFDVARSAQGRIRHFDRVRVNGQVNFSVVSRAVEPVAVVLAELLANATNYSAPGTPVEINIQAVPTGVCLIVDDAGLGMGQEEKDRAAALLSPRPRSASPAWASRRSSGSPSPGCSPPATASGSRWTPFPPMEAYARWSSSPTNCSPRRRRLPPRPPKRPKRPFPRTAGAAGGPVAGPGSGAHPALPAHPAARHRHPAAGPDHHHRRGLPKRRRKSPVSAVPSAEPQPVRSNEETASRLGAFQRGTRSGRDTTTTEGPEFQ